ncbi:hypothetical protein H7J86_03500 [Mycobacterium hackensackense]|uniref:hypothetical protein n=1 Tax=Mycobacterium hackensackense TaxID=228909 RepID=UPI002265B8E5|nr:hypothetical protein [Mycobacterium hackensackense]MCV7251217.1 hypothetical protein [Mycobacterium hackensackense]
MADYDGGSASVRIRPNMSRFSTDLDADLRRVDATVEVAARIGDIDDATLTAWRAEQEAREVHVRVTTDTSAIDRAVNELSRSTGGLGGGLNPGGLLLGLSPALIDPVIASVGALSTSVLQLAEAGLVLPGAIGGAVASIGTFKLGLSGMEDAYTALEKAQDGSAKSAAAANKAMGELAPSARAFLTEFMGIKTEFMDNNVQQNLFSDLATSARELASRDLPILKSGLGDIATSLNDNIKTLFSSLGSEQGQGILDRILGNTADAQARLSAVIDPLVRGLGTLTAAGTDALPGLADALGTASERFATFIEAADKDGSLKKWIDEGIDAAGNLLGTVKNIGDAFVSIARNAGGDGLLGTLDDLTGKFADWLRTAEGQNSVRQFFEDAKKSAAEWLPILRDIPGILGGIIQGGRDIASVVVPPFRDISHLLSENRDLAKAVLEGFLAWKTAQFAAGIVGEITKISGALGAKGGGGLLGKLGAAMLMFQVLNDQHLPGVNGPGPYTGPDLGGQATSAATGALLGGQVAGVPGAVIGGAAGATAPVIIDLATPDPSAENGVLPTAPNSANPATVGGIPIPGLQMPSREQGGVTDGPTSGYPAILHGREFVQQASAVAKYGVPFMNAVNEGRLDPSDLPMFDTGGYIDEHGNPIYPGGAMPGPVGPAPQQASGGLMSALGSFLSGVQAPLGNVLALGQGLAGQHGGGADGPAQSFNGFSNPLASVPGVWGLAGALGGQNPASDLMQWGSNTADWMGKFVSNTAMKFGTTLWQGALGMVGLENSILSPNNAYMKAAMEGLGYYGDLSGSLAGDSSGRGEGKGATAKQMREAADRISDRDAAVAIAEARVRELGSDATDSQRLSAQNARDRAVREAAEARDDLASLQQGGGTVLNPAGGASLYATAPTGSSGGAERWRPTVMAALQQVGGRYGITNIDGWADALIGQIQFESGGNPGALNPKDSDGLPAIGLGQFKQGTFNAHNITGGSINDGVTQIYAMIDYVSSRYGQNAAGIPNGINQGHGYAVGGEIQGIGGPTSDLVPIMASAKEHMFSVADVEAMGGHDNVYAFRAALHTGGVGGYAPGGELLMSPGMRQAWNATMQHAPTPPRPSFNDGQHAQTMNPRPSAPAPAPAPSGPPAATLAPAAPPVPGPALEEPSAPGTELAPPPVFTTNAPAPTSYDHNLAAVNTAIDSSAAVLGNIAATAASMGMGATGGGGMGAGLASSMIQGGVQQAGKVAKGVANVVSSSLVGNTQLGTPNLPAYGWPATMVRPQELPSAELKPHAQAGGGGPRTYVGGIYGHNTQDVFRELRIREAQDQQGSFAGL